MTCRSCGAAVLWCVTTTGKRMPLDAAPVPAGNVVLRDGVAHVTTTPQPGEARYVSHFSTCAQAKSWRKR